MTVPPRITVRWHHARPTFDADIVERHAPAVYRAVQGGAIQPIIDDVPVIDILLKYQQERDHNWPADPPTTTTADDELL